MLVLILLLVDVALAVLFGLARSIDIPTFHVDGAYQTASGLYRLTAGQWAGKDFYPYLGIGPLYLLYPLFLLAGGHVAASVFAAHFLTVSAAAFSVGMIAALTIGSRRALTGVIVGSLFLCAVVFMYPHFMDSDLGRALIERVTPGNSLRPLRAFLPYVCAAAAWLILRSHLRPPVIYGSLGAVVGASLLWSNDFGIPTVACLLLIGLLRAWSVGELSLSVCAACLGAGVVSASIGLASATHGHGIDLLKYSLSDVRHDQYWYFAPWLPEFRVLSLRDLFDKLFFKSYFEGLYRPEIGWWGLVLAGVGALALAKRSIHTFLLLFIGLSLFGGGLVATIGGHLGSYFSPFEFWCYVTLIAAVVAVVIEAAKRILRILPSRRQLMARAGPPALVVLVLVLAGVTISGAAIEYRAAWQAARTDPQRFFVPELGGYLPVEWKAHIERARVSRQTPFLEEYWGLWGSVIRQHADVPVDSVIHALGATRNAFEHAINHLPSVVITTTRSLTPDWQPWNVSTNWWFYKPLLQHYEPTKSSPSTLIWEKTRASQRAPWPEVPCRVAINPTGPVFILSAPSDGYYEVAISYRFDPRSAKSLLLVRNDLNYAGGAAGYIPLDPHASARTFPVAVPYSGEHVFDFRLVTAKDDFSRLQVEACTAKKILFDHPEALPAIRSIKVPTVPKNVSNDEFERGVARHRTAIVVEDSVDARARLQPGITVKFRDGTSRLIASQRPKGEGLILEFLGPLFDPGAVGSPRPFEIQR